MTDSMEHFAADQQFFITQPAQFMRWLPWLHIFRGFRIAIDYKKMFAALLAVVTWMFASHGLLVLFQDSQDPFQIVQPNVGNLNVQQDVSFLIEKTKTWDLLSHGANKFERDDPVETFLSSRPSITSPIMRVSYWWLEMVYGKTSSAWWHGLFQVVLGLIVSALFGGWICRMAAREFTGHERQMIRDGKFAVGQFPVAILGPAIVLSVFCILYAINWVAGFLSRMPVMGELILSLSWMILNCIGFVMSLLLIGLLFGWPLMIASSAVERNDAGDAMSRSLGYLWTQPWYAFFLFSLSLIYGTLLLTVVGGLTHLSVAATFSSVGAGRGSEVQVLETTSLLQFREQSQLLVESGAGRWIMRFWLGLVALIPAAFAFSFFWSSTTIGYFLLRRREDGTPLDVIDLSDSAPLLSGLPIVGMPAAEIRESERNAGDAID